MNKIKFNTKNNSYGDLYCANLNSNTLIVALHSLGATIDAMPNFTKLNELGVNVLYPQSRGNVWDFTDFTRTNPDLVLVNELIDKALEYLDTKFSTTQENIFLYGFGAGAAMCDVVLYNDQWFITGCYRQSGPWYYKDNFDTPFSASCTQKIICAHGESWFEKSMGIFTRAAEKEYKKCGWNTTYIVDPQGRHEWFAWLNQKVLTELLSDD